MNWSRKRERILRARIIRTRRDKNELRSVDHRAKINHSKKPNHAATQETHAHPNHVGIGLLPLRLMKDPTKKDSIGLGLDPLEMLLATAGLIVVSGLLLEYGQEIKQDWIDDK